MLNIFQHLCVMMIMRLCDIPTSEYNPECIVYLSIGRVHYEPMVVLIGWSSISILWLQYLCVFVLLGTSCTGYLTALFRAKTLCENADPLECISVKLQSKYNHFNSRKMRFKCYHFKLGSLISILHCVPCVLSAFHSLLFCQHIGQHMPFITSAWQPEC